MYNFGGIISILSLKIIKESHVFSNSCPFQKIPLQKKPLFSQAKTSVVFFLDSTVRLSVLAQILPGCGSATSVASSCKIVNETSGSKWLKVNFSKIYVSCHIWQICSTYYKSMNSQLSWFINPFRSIQVPFFLPGCVEGSLWKRLWSKAPNSIQPMHSSWTPLVIAFGKFGKFWKLKKSKKNPMYVHGFFQVSTLTRGETTDCHCHSHPRKGVGWLFSLDFCVCEVHVADVYGQRSLPHHHTPPQSDWSHLAQWLSWWLFREQSIHHTVVVLWASRNFSATSRYTASWYTQSIILANSRCDVEGLWCSPELRTQPTSNVGVQWTMRKGFFHHGEEWQYSGSQDIGISLWEAHLASRCAIL